MRPDIVARYQNQRVPRYTSYPTSPHFRAGFQPETYRDWLGALDAARPVSLYLHVPYCRTLCWYCGCHTVASRHDGPVQRYVQALCQEIGLVTDQMPEAPRVAHLHFGGGTPTLVGPAAFLEIMEALRRRAVFEPGAEIAVEIDPRTLTAPMVAALAGGGVTRASLGVQSFDPEVQWAINRVQSFETTAAAVSALRGAGVRGINLDLVYGLPRQTVASCRDTVARSLELAPDRLSVFGYAHVPDFKRHQRLIDAATLPDATERLAQADAIADALVAAGYVRIGLDHFARPGDSMAVAAADGTLRRNFQGYTTDGADTLIGFGASAIGRLPQGYVQNIVPVGDYVRAVESGTLPVAKGHALTPEDRLRAAIIERIMCDYRVDVAELARRHGFTPETLAPDPAELARLRADGLVELRGTEFRVPAEARPLVRSVAALFDAYLDPTAGRHAKAI